MSVPLVILGYLKERDYHGYELKKQIQRHMGNWTDIKFGSIYHALKKLVERGCVEVAGEERHSGRPDRTVYCITEKGRREFQILLSGLLLRYQRIYQEFDIGLYFARHLPGEELSKVLEKRQTYVQSFLQKLDGVKQLPAHQNLPKISEIIVDHALYYLNAEMNWLKMCIRRQREEDLYASPQALPGLSHPGGK